MDAGALSSRTCETRSATAVHAQTSPARDLPTAAQTEDLIARQTLLSLAQNLEVVAATFQRMRGGWDDRSPYNCPRHRLTAAARPSLTLRNIGPPTITLRDA